MSLYTETDMRRYAQGFELKETAGSSLAQRLFSSVGIVVAEEAPAVASEFFKQVGVVREASEQVIATGQLIETYGVPEDAVGVDTLSPALYLRLMEQQKTEALLDTQLQTEEKAGLTIAELEAKAEEIQKEIRAVTEQIKALIREIEAEKAAREDLKIREARQEDDPGRLDGIRVRNELIAFKEQKIEGLRKKRVELRKTLSALGYTQDEVEDASAMVAMVDHLAVSRGALTIKQN